MAASVAQEFYKVRDYWAKAGRQKSWRLAIWVAEFQDVDIIDKFIEIERSPLGSFDDLFFRFDTEYKGDAQVFERALWQEFLEWFAPVPDPQYDMYAALKNDGMLKADFVPDTALAPTAANLWKELLRFKNSIIGLEADHFCIYFPPTRPDSSRIGDWFGRVLSSGVPRGIRLVTIDYAVQRKVNIPVSTPGLVKELKPVLNMVAAINNEMDKNGGSYDTTGSEARFRKQVRALMNSTTTKDAAIVDKEVDKLLQISRQMNSPASEISSWMIAAQAYFSINEPAKSEQYANTALTGADKAMKKKEPFGYPVWKGCMMLKGALLIGQKNPKAAMEVYEQLAFTATSYGDSFFVMEGYRLMGHLLYEEGRLAAAFEAMLLSLAGGSYLEANVRRQSTFLHAAYMALYLAEASRPAADVQVLEAQLAAWLGNDWKELLAAEGMEKAKQKRKKSLFEF
jgi:hypothetical protein